MNYTIPPRNKASDYSKGRITQDEIIALQISNDANIAAARQAIKMGEIQQLTPMESASTMELLADDAAQEASARTNVMKLGFKDQEAARIITNMRNDSGLDFNTLNANFPAIEADIKSRFNVKLLTPTFFLEYLKKYSDELAGSAGMKVFLPHNGGFNGLVNTIAELRSIIPDPDVIEYIRKAGQDSRAVGENLLRGLDRLTEILPNSRNLEQLSNISPVNQQNIITAVLNQFRDMPSGDEIRGFVNSLRNDRISRDDIRRFTEEIVNAMPRGRQENILATATGVERSRDETTEEALARRDASRAEGRPPPLDRPQLAIKWLGDNVNSMTDFNNLNMGDKKAFMNQVGLAPYLRNENNGKMYMTQLSRASVITSNAGAIVRAYLQLKGRIPENTKIVDSGLDDEFKILVGQGLRNKGIIKPNIKLKVGRGLAIKEMPSYREYGKYAIHIPQLEQQDILNVKYKSLGQVPKFKPIPVSDIFRDFILDLIENGKPNARVYSQISTEERKYFEEMSIGAGVWNGLGLKRTTTSNDEEENKRFELLRGEYIAGNNNVKVMSELRKLTVKMMNDGRIRKNQGVELLMELSV